MKNKEDIDKLLKNIAFYESKVFIGEWYKLYNEYNYEFVIVKDSLTSYIELRKKSTTSFLTETIFIFQYTEYEQIYNGIKKEFNHIIRKQKIQKIL